MAVTIGFYAIPELVERAVQRSSIAQIDVNQVGGVWRGVRDTFRHLFRSVQHPSMASVIA